MLYKYKKHTDIHIQTIKLVYSWDLFLAFIKVFAVYGARYLHRYIVGRA